MSFDNLNNWTPALDSRGSGILPPSLVKDGNTVVATWTIPIANNGATPQPQSTFSDNFSIALSSMTSGPVTVPVSVHMTGCA